MGIEDVLAKKRDAIVQEWFEKVANTYPPDTAQFVRSSPDAFSNPIGGSLHSGLPVLFDQLLTEPDRETIRQSLDPIVRIRAVQDFSPAEAIAFILVLKNIARKHVIAEINDSRAFSELLRFESKIDNLSLFAFDLYIACREKIYELKTHTERNKIYKAFERAGLIDETPNSSSSL